MSLDTDCRVEGTALSLWFMVSLQVTKTPQAHSYDLDLR